LKKYKQNITKYQEISNYPYEVTLSNPANKTVTRIFLNEYPDFLGYQEKEPIREKGYLLTRRHYLSMEDTPYIDLSYEKVSSY
jgi:hypothetical protein